MDDFPYLTPKALAQTLYQQALNQIHNQRIWYVYPIDFYLTAPT